MKLCIIQPAINVASETFIRAHAEQLPFDTTVIHGVNSGVACIGEKPTRSQSLLARAVRKLGRRLHGRSWDWAITDSVLAGLRKVEADVVLAEYGTTGVRVMEACRLAGVPLVVHFHGFDASNKRRLDENRDGYRDLFQRAGAVVAVSHVMRRQLITLGAPPERVVYCPYGVDCKRFVEARPERNPPVLLAVGRLVEKKAPYLTLAAFAEVNRARPDTRLRIIGDGPLLGPCRDLAAGMGIMDAVDFLGEQTHEAVQREMVAARAFVQHSVVASTGDSEGTPVAILEACASGLPVVSTRHAGIPDVVRNRETGLLVDERDVPKMSEQMLQLIDRPRYAAELGSAGRIRIKNWFTMDQSIDRLAAIIEASARGAPAPHFDDLVAATVTSQIGQEQLV